MIRVDDANLVALVDAESKTWRKRASDYTVEVKALGSFSDKKLNGKAAPDWSDIKAAFMAIQHNKCAYCERALETAHELDVEHFRPKNQVTPWVGPPTPAANGRSDGYWWLAYALANYCVACKPCNSGLKADHFPIDGAAGAKDADVGVLDAAEVPLLLFPLGTRDVDPETVIGWMGVSPVPLGAPGTRARRRGETTIAFFDLAGRELLDRQRADQILVLWRWLDIETDPNRSVAEQAAARKKVDRHLSSPKKPMLACLRAFAKLARADRAVVVPLINAIELLVAP